MKTELVKLDESNSVRVQFYIVLPPDGLVPGMKVEKIYRNLAISELWDKLGRDVSVILEILIFVLVGCSKQAELRVRYPNAHVG